MTTKLNTLRKRAERRKRKAEGLVLAAYWIKPEAKPQLDFYVEVLKKL